MATFRVLAQGDRDAAPATALRPEGPCCAAEIVRQQQAAAAPTASNRGCSHENAEAPDRSVASPLHLAEQAPAVVAGALSQLVPQRQPPSRSSPVMLHDLDPAPP